MQLAKGLFTVLVGLTSYQLAIAAPDQAFQDGKSFAGAVDPAAVAKTGAGSVTFGGQTFGVGDINSMSIQQGGNGNLAQPPEASLSGSSTLDPSAAYLNTDPAGDAAQFTSSAFGSRPIFTVDPNTDPMVLKKNTIQTNPSSITGTAGGSFTGCTPTQTTTPPVYSEKICNISINTQTQTCQKILNVTVQVDWVPNCTAGNVIATSVSAQGCSQNNGLDTWVGNHAAAVCEYTNPGFQKLTHRLRIQEHELSSSGCGSNPVPPNLWQMTSPAYLVNDAIITMPQTLYSYLKWSNGWVNANVSYVGGCTGGNCNYTIMNEGRWNYTYPACPQGQTDGAGYVTNIDDGFGNITPTQVEVITPGACYVVEGVNGDGVCNAGKYYYSTESTQGCLAPQGMRTPSGYTITGATNTLNYIKPAINKVVTETDSIDNQCAGLEVNSL